MRIENTSSSDPGSISVSFYASADTSITPSDAYLGQTNVWLPRGLSATVTLRSTFPASVPQGSYYVGWIIDPNNHMVEADESNNTGYKSAPLLKVVRPSPSVLYVDAGARGASDGSNWKNAFTSLQDALSVAGPGGEIRIAGGVYTPDQGVGFSLGNREAGFILSGGITVRGGYAGAASANPDTRNLQTYPTVLSGDINSNDLPVSDPGNLGQDLSRTDNSRHVITGVIGKGETTLDGVQVTGGYAFGPSVASTVTSGMQGGGLLMTGGSLVLSNCLFTGNWASGDGGAVCIADGQLQLNGCTFRTNGAGLHNRLAQARGTGGAIRSDGRSQLTLTRCKFYGNFAGLQGGALDNDRGTVVLTWCLFIQNTAGAAGGGAVWHSDGRLNLVSCTLNGNRSEANGGAIVNGWNGILNAANCSLHANYSAARAGAIHNFAGAKTTLWNCTLAGNRQDGGRGVIVCGAAPGSAVGELTIANSILWNGGSEISNEDKTIVTVGSANVQGGWPGVDILNTDPLFVRPAGPDGSAGTEDDNLRLGLGSPCVDRGSSALLPQDFADLNGDGNLKERLPLDLDRRERVTGSEVDLGAYEVQPDSSASAPISTCASDY